MKYSNKKKKNKIFWYYKFLFIFIIIFMMFFLLSNVISNYVYSSNVKSYMVDLFLKPVSYLNKFNIVNYNKLLNKNRKLEKEVISLRLKNDKMDINKKELDDLRTLTKENLYTDYKKIYAKTIERNKMYYYSTITIDKGTKAGVKNGSLVVDSLGLIGTVKSTSLNSSTIELITNNNDNNKLSIEVNTSNGVKYGTIESYKYPYLKIELLTNDNNVKIDDNVETSGLGDLPKGVKLGQVKKIEKDSYNLTSILYVLPYSDMDDISYVMVLVK